MNILEINFDEQVQDDTQDMLCYPDEHDMIAADDEGEQIYFCQNCGFSATAYIYQNFLSEQLPF